MGFGRKMDDGGGLSFRHQFFDERLIANVALHKAAARMLFNALQGIQVACVGKLVEIQNMKFRLLQSKPDKVAADKTGPAGDKKRCFHN